MFIFMFTYIVDIANLITIGLDYYNGIILLDHKINYMYFGCGLALQFEC